jgi:GNAT superfamily N-acetyltransferase
MTEAAEFEFDTPSVELATTDLVLWALYDTSFPANEREPRDVILASIAANKAVLARARAGGTTLGFSVTHILRNPPAAFLVYLAVSPEHRGSGIGGRLFEYSWNASKKLASSVDLMLQGIAWEIDIPEGSETTEEHERRSRRRAFFGRLGGEQLDVNYVQPPVNGPAVPMLLMWRSAKGMLPQINQLIRAIYYEKYGAANGIRAEILDDLLARALLPE